MTTINGANGHTAADGQLRGLLIKTMEKTGLSMTALTVMSARKDPFRLDTPANRRNAEWLATWLEEHPHLRHLRGMHYAMIGNTRPDGVTYLNTESHEGWLDDAINAARWLAYIPFERVDDHRNAEPVIRPARSLAEPGPVIASGVEVDLDPNIHPRVELDEFAVPQPYRLAIFGEKSSLERELAPVADRRNADLFLATGNSSQTLVYRLAESASRDGRPLHVFYLHDCDPGGWGMPNEVGRKLAALKVTHFPDLEFVVHRVGILFEHVRAEGLEGSPLKEGERRADKWREATGLEQTELDAFLTHRPGMIARLTEEAIAPFFDTGLARRTRELRRAWEIEAQAVIDASLDTPEMEAVRVAASEKLDELDEQIAAINQALRVDASAFDLPDLPVLPTPEIDETAQPVGLVDSRDPFDVQTRGLVADRRYETGIR